MADDGRREPAPKDDEPRLGGGEGSDATTQGKGGYMTGQEVRPDRGVASTDETGTGSSA